MVRVLVKTGSNVETRAQQGHTPLHFTTDNGHVETIRVLVENGADALALTDTQNSALHMAADRGHGETARLLVELGCDAYAPSAGGWTPLRWAAAGGHKEIFKILSDNIDVYDDAGKTWEGAGPGKGCAAPGYRDEKREARIEANNNINNNNNKHAYAGIPVIVLHI
jgi:ankyrin repeat protein